MTRRKLHMRQNRRDEILRFIKSSYKERGFPPSVGEIALATGLASKYGVLCHLRKMVDEGTLLYRDGKYLPLNVVGTQNDMVMVPIIGTIAAGIPIDAVEEFDGFVAYLPSKNISDKKLFALRVKGDSMIEIGINDGDIVIVQQQPEAENGEIVAAMIDGEATVKRFFAEHGHYRLQPENAAMKPFIVNEVTILGKVISSMRNY